MSRTIRFTIILAILGSISAARGELSIPAATAYIDPDPNGARVSKSGITR